MSLPKPTELVAQMADARARTLALFDGLAAVTRVGHDGAVEGPAA